MKEMVMRIGNRVSINCLPCVCIGIVYLWFGMLKFFPGVSPAETIALDTISELTLGVVTPDVSIILLALWETIIGVLLIIGLFSRAALNLAIVHMILTFTPFLFFPELTFTNAPFGLTLLGQYIVKNIVFLAIMIYILSKERKTERKLFS
ncbi:DoxX family protein [Maribacter sp. HTCC2170]|uniref:DoxX family protein n=1 Tax=Maribacter sp. (strain HTCC2170 / KCCM 42371) TaxID=313603 RepID=UPI000323C8EB|nr:DoxX family protein [Maribacter sp. HTCC2170]